MLCTRVTTRGSAENEPSVSPATATLSPTTSCWSFRGIYLSARTRPFNCQMVFPLDSVSIKHSPPEMCITCTLTLPMIQNGCGVDAPVMNVRAMRMFAVLAIDRTGLRSTYQAAYVFITIATRFLQRGQGRSSNFEPHGKQAARWPQGTNTESMGRSKQTTHSFSSGFGFFSGGSCGGSHGALSFLACTRR